MKYAITTSPLRSIDLAKQLDALNIVYTRIYTDGGDFVMCAYEMELSEMDVLSLTLSIDLTQHDILPEYIVYTKEMFQFWGFTLKEITEGVGV